MDLGNLDPMTNRNNLSTQPPPPAASLSNTIPKLAQLKQSQIYLSEDSQDQNAQAFYTLSGFLVAHLSVCQGDCPKKEFWVLAYLWPCCRSQKIRAGRTGPKVKTLSSSTEVFFLGEELLETKEWCIYLKGKKQNNTHAKAKKKPQLEQHCKVFIWKMGKYKFKIIFPHYHLL